jgi:hypothetical protein
MISPFKLPFIGDVEPVPAVDHAADQNLSPKSRVDESPPRLRGGLAVRAKTLYSVGSEGKEREVFDLASMAQAMVYALGRGGS